MKITALEGSTAADAARTLLPAALAAALVLAAAFVPASSARPDAAGTERTSCLTPADVRRHAERSREGISLVCSEEIRQRELQRERSL